MARGRSQTLLPYSKCKMGNTSIKTPKSRYSEILINISDKMTADDKEKFKFLFRSVIPAKILEKDEPLQWFGILERRGHLAFDKLDSIENFLQQASLIKLRDDVRAGIIKWKILEVLKKDNRSRGRLGHVVEIPESLDVCEQQLSNNFLKKCRNMIDRFKSPAWDEKTASILLNKSVKLYLNCCRVEGYQPNQMACKLLHLAEMLYEKFGSWLMEIYPKFPIQTFDERSEPHQDRRPKRRRRKPVTTVDSGTEKIIGLLQETNRHLSTLSLGIHLIGWGIVLMNIQFLFSTSICYGAYVS